MLTTKVGPLSIALTLAVLIVYSFSACDGADTATRAERQQQNQAINDDLVQLEPCFTQAAFGFSNRGNGLPTTFQELQTSCSNKTMGLKCLKDLSRRKGLQALLKRAINSFVTSRQRFHKKYCTNVNSQASQKAVENFKCIVDKKLSDYNKLDTNYASEMVALKNDRTLGTDELKYFCCIVHKYRKGIIDTSSPQCPNSRDLMEEMIRSVVPEDINIICDDEDKLNEKCPKMKPLDKKPYVSAPGNSPEFVSIYLIATLGERE